METVEEKIKMLMEQEEFAFIKDIPHEQLWKLAFALNFIQESDWIPVSERLPETDDSVLLFYESHYCRYVGNKIVDKGINYFTTIAFYDEDNKEWYENTEWSRHDDIISYPLAWMPLPEPYKAESEDKE